MHPQPVYEEKQYLGRNKHMLAIRLILSAFCFAAYYASRNRETSADHFLVLGIGILFFSSILTFMVHFRTKIINKSIELEKFWMIRKVKIPIKNIRSVEVVKYARFYVNNPVFNLHLKGQIHFYTTGDKVIRITDKDGLIYLLGSQQPERLMNVIKEQMKELLS